MLTQKKKKNLDETVIIQKIQKEGLKLLIYMVKVWFKKQIWFLFLIFLSPSRPFVAVCPKA